jgi:hypothetical protein
LLMFGTGRSGRLERRGVADVSLPPGGFRGVAALPFGTPWPLIEICARSLFTELQARSSEGC